MNEELDPCLNGFTPAQLFGIYREAVNGVAYDGEPIPAYADCAATAQQGWQAVAAAVNHVLFGDGDFGRVQRLKELIEGTTQGYIQPLPQTAELWRQLATAKAQRDYAAMGKLSDAIRRATVEAQRGNGR